LDQKGFEEVDQYAQKAKKAIETGNFIQAASFYSWAASTITELAGRVDFYNILSPIRWRFDQRGEDIVMKTQSLMENIRS